MSKKNPFKVKLKTESGPVSHDSETADQQAQHQTSLILETAFSYYQVSAATADRFLDWLPDRK